MKPLFNTSKLQEKVKEVPWILASHAFSIIIFFIFITFLIGGFLFYQYVVLAKARSQNIIDNSSVFEYATYEQILTERAIKDHNLETSKDKEYLNPFIGINQTTVNE